MAAKKDSVVTVGGDTSVLQMEMKKGAKVVESSGKKIRDDGKKTADTVKKEEKKKAKAVKDAEKKIQAELKRTSASMAKMGAAAVAAAAVLVGALGKSAVESAAEIKRLAKVSNASTDEFQRLAFGAKKFGIEQEKLGDILKDMNDRVGDFLTTGAGPMADFFEKIGPKVGVTAKDFKNLSGPQVLQLFTSSLEKANITQAESIFFMESMAGDLALLLPLYENNAKAMKELGAEADRLGLILDKRLIDNAQQLNKDLSTTADVIKIQLNAAFLELAPLISTALNKFTSFLQVVRNASLGPGDVEGIMESPVGAAFAIEEALDQAQKEIKRIEELQRTFQGKPLFARNLNLGKKLDEELLKVKDFVEGWNTALQGLLDLPDAVDSKTGGGGDGGGGLINTKEIDALIDRFKSEVQTESQKIQALVDDLNKAMAGGLPQNIADQVLVKRLQEVADNMQRAEDSGLDLKQQFTEMTAAEKEALAVSVRRFEILQAMKNPMGDLLAQFKQFSADVDSQVNLFDRNKLTPEEAETAKHKKAQSLGLIQGPEFDSGAAARIQEEMDAKLKSLQDSFLPALELEELMERESHQRRLEELDSFLGNTRLKEDEHADLRLELEKKHTNAMASIRANSDRRHQQQLIGAGQSVLSAAGRLNDDMFKQMQVGSAALSLINAYLAASQTLADPSLGFFTKLAAAATVLAQGIGFATAIKGLSSSSSGAGGGQVVGAGGIPATPVANVGGGGQSVFINLHGDTFGPSHIRQLIKEMNEATKNGARIQVTS